MVALTAPAHGVTVRMYRQGQGDCFLLAFPREQGGDPVYVLIDCGFKPGSPRFLRPDETDDGSSIAATVDQIAAATGERLDLVVITHEHEDHVNGFLYGANRLFDRFAIGEAWLAWTEDPGDQLAVKLRKSHGDQLLQLVAARQRLAAAGDDDNPAVRGIDRLIALALGSWDGALPADAAQAAADPAKSRNKQAMKLVKDRAQSGRGISYLSPGAPPLPIPGTSARVFVLGPPRRERSLRDEDPRAGEAFPTNGVHGFSFGDAALADDDDDLPALFGRRHAVPSAKALGRQGSFFAEHYGGDDAGDNDTDEIAVPDDARWRRIDDEWLYSAESLALKLTEGVNNTSLVLAIELPETKKVLLFVGDAQRGNWFSWKNVTWQEDGATVTARDLLARTVLYKVGHHGSHNATLDGTAQSEHANLSWMAAGAAAREFTAMIPAVSSWARTQGWTHPLPSIDQALTARTQGRVFHMDADQPVKPADVAPEIWDEFLARCDFAPRYFDYTVMDE